MSAAPGLAGAGLGARLARRAEARASRQDIARTAVVPQERRRQTSPKFVKLYLDPLRLDAFAVSKSQCGLTKVLYRPPTARGGRAPLLQSRAARSHGEEAAQQGPAVPDADRVAGRLGRQEARVAPALEDAAVQLLRYLVPTVRGADVHQGRLVLRPVQHRALPQEVQAPPRHR
eukprot:scaffold114755_cov45-Phaeocystis_antarctica.AAC.1